MDRRRVQQRGRLRRLASVWLSTGQFRTSCGYAWKGLLLGVDICAVGWLRHELLLVNERAPFEHFLCRELSSDRAARSQSASYAPILPAASSLSRRAPAPTAVPPARKARREMARTKLICLSPCPLACVSCPRRPPHVS